MKKTLTDSYQLFEKVSRIFLHIILILAALAIIGLIIVNISDSVKTNQINNESANIKEFIQNNIDPLAIDNEIEIESVVISPRDWLFPVSEKIPLSCADIKIIIKCDESTKHEDKAKYISLAKNSAEKYLISEKSLYKNDDIDCISLFCGTPKEIQYASDPEKCLNLSFYNHTVRLDNEDIPMTEYDKHCIMFTLCRVCMSDLIYFKDCIQITVKDIIDLSADSDFSEFEKLEYIDIIMKDDDEYKRI